jgi:bifunctional non-homologous end joining protein LigD
VTFEQTKSFARTVAQRVEEHHGERVVSKMAKALRPGKVFIDWSQNDSHKTTVCVYSLRATPRPQVSAPVTWQELQQAVEADDVSRLAFTPEQALERIGEQGDLYEPALTLRQRLPGSRPPEIAVPAVWTSGGGRHATKNGKDALAEYRRKRHFGRTPEPKGKIGGKSSSARFVIHKHAARALHYDLRLEVDGVLKSWAVPKGPSLDPADKRLAVRTEDHPLVYGDFEGCIPAGEYGGGEVVIWDRGVYRRLDGNGSLTAKDVEGGHLKLWLDGVKLLGAFNLVRTGVDDSGKEQWLLIKKLGDTADTQASPVRTEPQSVLSGLWTEDLRAAAKHT